MQGPVQPSPGRRAGDSRTSGQDTGGLKDWQRNTWYGPAPSNSNPFEEPESAPELLEARSSNVSNHTGSFWSDQGTTGYQYSTEEMKKQPAGTGTTWSSSANSWKRPVCARGNSGNWKPSSASSPTAASSANSLRRPTPCFRPMKHRFPSNCMPWKTPSPGWPHSFRKRKSCAPVPNRPVSN